MNAERARLAERIADVERRAAWWSSAAARLDRQAAEHGAAYDAQQAQLAAAREQVEAVRAAVVAPLVEAATADAATLMDAKDRVREADAARRTAGRFRRRGAERIWLAADQDRTVIETAVRDRWGSAPSSAERVLAWTEAVAGRRADVGPQVVEAGQAAARAQQDASRLAARQMGEREQLRRAIYRDPYSRVSAKSRAEDYTRQAANDRRLLARLEALPPEQAAAMIRERAEANRIAAAALAERAVRLRMPARAPHRPSPSTRPDFGPSL